VPALTTRAAPRASAWAASAAASRSTPIARASPASLSVGIGGDELLLDVGQRGIDGQGHAARDRPAVAEAATRDRVARDGKDAPDPRGHFARLVDAAASVRAPGRGNSRIGCETGAEAGGRDARVADVECEDAHARPRSRPPTCSAGRGTSS
jgi:hypothetical protein